MTAPAAPRPPHRLAALAASTLAVVRSAAGRFAAQPTTQVTTCSGTAPATPGEARPGTHRPGRPASRAASSKWHIAIPMSTRWRSASRSSRNVSEPFPYPGVRCRRSSHASPLRRRTMRHGCLFEAEGARRTASSAAANGPACSAESGVPSASSKNSSLHGLRSSAPRLRRIRPSWLPECGASEGGDRGHALARGRADRPREPASREAPSEPARPEAQRGGAQDRALHRVAVVFEVVVPAMERADDERRRPRDEAIAPQATEGAGVVLGGRDEPEAHRRAERSRGGRGQQGLDLRPLLRRDRLRHVRAARVPPARERQDGASVGRRVSARPFVDRVAAGS